MTDHSKAAKYYHYRPAYLPMFFEGCAQTLDLDGSQRMLDVACGTGAVARGFAPYVDSIIAFDGNKNMIDIARKETANDPKVQILYTLFDDLDVSGTFDLVTFGRSIHWMDREPTLSALRRLLKKNGHIIVCGSGIQGDDISWLQAYEEVRYRWWGFTKNDRHEGFHTFRKSDFVPICRIESDETRKYTIDDLVKQSLSFAGLTSRVEAETENYRGDLEAALLPFLRNGALEARIVTWGHVFRIKRSVLSNRS
jgi:SAM-dependent methyltransferase